MVPRTTPRSTQQVPGRQRLAELINPHHRLARLAGVIDWSAIEARFGALYVAGVSRPGVPIRLMVGLHYLKHAFDLSDEEVVERWVENPYWQHLCGEPYFRHDLPIDPSQMTRFRQRVGPAGCEFMLALSVQAGLATKAVAPASPAVVNVDTTVQERAIAFPTDARLYQKARAALVRLAKKVGLALRQSYERLGKAALAMNGRYAHARQLRRARAQQKRLRTYLGRVIRDIERRTAGRTELERRFERLLNIAKRIHAQTRQRADPATPKLYSVHAPEVECIAKGKAHRPYEFGVKVGVVTTSKESFVLGCCALPGYPYDGHTLAVCLQQAARVSGAVPAEAYVDRGYKGHRLRRPSVWIAGAKRGVTAAIHRKLKRRNAIEPVIGHMRTDGRLSRNFLKGSAGDAMNAILCGAGHNIRKILRHLALAPATRSA